MDYNALILAKASGEQFEGRELVTDFYQDVFTYANTDPLIVELKLARDACNELVETGELIELTGSNICYCLPWMTHWVNNFAGRKFQRA